MVLNDKPLIIKLLPLIGLLGVIAIVIAALLLTRPKADRSFTPPETQVAIAVNTLEAKPYTVQIQSYEDFLLAKEAAHYLFKPYGDKRRGSTMTGNISKIEG